MSAIRLIIDVEWQRSFHQEEVLVEDIVERALKSTRVFGAVSVAVDQSLRNTHGPRRLAHTCVVSSTGGLHRSKCGG